MTETATESFRGTCTCGHVVYQMSGTPMFVHCCHCRWCQRETGSAFALNAMVETDNLHVQSGEIETVSVPSESGTGQDIVRCIKCRIALWSHYSGLGERLGFVRVATLDQAERFPPDIHIYTDSKQDWVILPSGVPSTGTYYRRSEYWPEASRQRYIALRDSRDQ
jgi:hypothetical protein